MMLIFYNEYHRQGICYIAIASISLLPTKTRRISKLRSLYPGIRYSQVFSNQVRLYSTQVVTIHCARGSSARYWRKLC